MQSAISRDQLRRRREDLRLSLDDVALLLGRGHAGALSRWERGKPGVKLGGLTEKEYRDALEGYAKAQKRASR